MRLTEPMLRTLRADDVKLSVTLEAHEDEQGALKQIADASYVAELDGFLEATVHITNLRSECPKVFSCELALTSSSGGAA